jgi:choline dehydrogenase-like flavoprotein
MAIERFNVVVIGTGFGGSLTALTLARHFQRRGNQEKVLMLERGMVDHAG